MDSENTMTRVLTDDTQRVVEVPIHPQRILSLTSTYDTVLLDLVGPERLVAVNALSKYEDYSLVAEKAKKVNVTLRDYPVETVVKLHPDLVIAPEYINKDIIEAIDGMGIPVVVIYTGTTVEKAITMVGRMGYVVNEEEKSDTLVTKMKDSLDRLRQLGQKLPDEDKKTVLFISSMDGYAGTGSIVDDMCRYMSIINAPHKANYPPRTPFTDERTVEMNPDIVFIPVYRSVDEKWLQRYKHNPAIQSIEAVKNDQILPLRAAYLYTSNQYIGEVMEKIMAIVYPELFNSEIRSNQ